MPEVAICGKDCLRQSWPDYLASFQLYGIQFHCKNMESLRRQHNPAFYGTRELKTGLQSAKHFNQFHTIRYLDTNVILHPPQRLLPPMHHKLWRFPYKILDALLIILYACYMDHLPYAPYRKTIDWQYVHVVTPKIQFFPIVYVDSVQDATRVNGLWTA